MPTVTWNTTSGAAVAEQVWSGWTATTYTTSSSTATNFVWSSWNTTSSTISSQYRPSVRLTPEQIAADRERRRREREESQRLDQEHRRQWAEAAATAEELLRSNLTREQIMQLNEKESFEVKVYSQGKDNPKVYTIARGVAGNVHRDDEETINERVVKTRKRFCIHPTADIPAADVMLAQMLLLQANEKEFLKIANMTDLGQVA